MLLKVFTKQQQGEDYNEIDGGIDGGINHEAITKSY